MIAQTLFRGQAPIYHERMLIVKIRPSASEPRAAVANFAKLNTAASPGLAALASLEHAGRVKHVTPIARPRKGDEHVALPPRVAMGPLVASTERVAPEHLSAGVSVIELERDEDVSGLHTALANDSSVQFVSRVPIRYLMAGSTIRATAPPASTMWNLRKILWTEARKLPGFSEAADVRLAVLDTGVQIDHPDLVRRVKSYVYLYPDVPAPSGEQDIIGHGTHVSGTIGAIINNDIGINGICQAELHAWKIFSDMAQYINAFRGFGYFVEPVMYRRALADCLDAGIQVINLSIGGPGEPDPQEQQLFDSLLARGTVVVAAMGNDREAGSPTSYPAAIPGVIAVGATNIDDSVTTFSNRGDHIAVCAPGKSIWSTLPTYEGQFGFEAMTGPGGSPSEGRPFRRETDYDAWDGTSMACPHVAAAAALLLAKRRGLNAVQVRQALMATADKVPGMRGREFDSDYGAGRLNLVRLLER